MNNYLALLGLLLILISICKISWFIWPYFKKSSLQKYESDGAYAFITGATDGIGKAVAFELAKNGFNIILHSRNIEKLNLVRNELKKMYPKIEILILPFDGSQGTLLDFDFKNLLIKVLVNNVGVGPIKEFKEFSESEIESVIRLNAFFPTHLTRLILGYFQRPALILNVTSYAGLIPPPYLAVYAATKAYNHAFSRSLTAELKDIETISLITGSVHTASNKKPISFLRPNAEQYAKCIIARVGCGRDSVYPYWPHAIQTFIISCIPEKILSRVMRKALKPELPIS
jgi:17beta-estradiol 17-dehydrogenase / very-long-chain 3-oxoacyl-CoA reductase